MMNKTLWSLNGSSREPFTSDFVTGLINDPDRRVRPADINARNNNHTVHTFCSQWLWILKSVNIFRMDNVAAPTTGAGAISELGRSTVPRFLPKNPVFVTVSMISG